MLLSVCILTKGESEQVQRISAMVSAFADEVVAVVDAPVSDAFKNTAESSGIRIIPHEWQRDFAAARNAGLDAAQGDWVFWIDTDETLLSPSAPEFRRLLARPEVLGYYVNIEDVTGSDGMLPRQHPSLYRRRKELRYSGRIHEHFDAPLEVIAERLGMLAATSPVRLRHTGYQTNLRPEKLRRNIALLELELAERPGQLYYQIELGRSLLLTQDPKGHAVLGQAVEALRPALGNRQAPNPLTAALLEYALSLAPVDFPLPKELALELSERWFPSSPPLVWRAARWHYAQGDFARAAALLEKLDAMGRTGKFDHSISFDQRIFGDETVLNLGVCQARLGQLPQALQQFKRIKAGSSLFPMAQANLRELS